MSWDWEFSKVMVYAVLAGKTILILIIAKLGISFGSLIIDRTIISVNNSYVDLNRANTLSSLLKSSLLYSVYFIAAISILELFSIPYQGVLAGAGIVGLAVGFGAQNLVKDIITGFFILLENQFAVGEYITTSGVSGIVEELGLRATKIRDFAGQLHILPNGQITQVTNYNRGSMRALVDVGIDNTEDVDRALAVLEETCQEVAQVMAESLTEGPRVLGIQAFTSTEITLRIIARCKPLEQDLVERELRKRIKESFTRQGIKTPSRLYPGGYPNGQL